MRHPAARTDGHTGDAKFRDFAATTQSASDVTVLDSRWIGDGIHGTSAFQAQLAGTP